MTTLLAFLFVLGVLIFVHELGHFLAARRHGVRVLTFSLGFGPKILKVTRGDTEYCVSAIPLGGYVKMAGENPEDPRSGQPDEFLSKTKWQRFQILFAGPAMNIILAVVVLAFVLAQGAADVRATWTAAGHRRCRCRIRRPSRPGFSARRSDPDGRRATRSQTWEDLRIAIGTGVPIATSALTLLRDGQHGVRRPCGRSAEGRYEIGDIGVLPEQQPDHRLGRSRVTSPSSARASRPATSCWRSTASAWSSRREQLQADLGRIGEREIAVHGPARESAGRAAVRRRRIAATAARSGSTSRSRRSRSRPGRSKRFG